MEKHTVCGTMINKDGFLVSTKGITNEKAVQHEFKNNLIFFCEEICKVEFMEAENKEEWLLNHK